MRLKPGEAPKSNPQIFARLRYRGVSRDDIGMKKGFL